MCQLFFIVPACFINFIWWHNNNICVIFPYKSMLSLPVIEVFSRKVPYRYICLHIPIHTYRYIKTIYPLQIPQ
nr:MAG TPA: hypothetical protein [Caudoviricetes sp.]